MSSPRFYFFNETTHSGAKSSRHNREWTSAFYVRARFIIQGMLMTHETLTVETAPLPEEATVSETSLVPGVVRTWQTFGSGNFNDPNNWFPAGSPADGDFVSFEVGAGL